jgi:hypothetical protein
VVAVGEKHDIRDARQHDRSGITVPEPFDNVRCDRTRSIGIDADLKLCDLLSGFIPNPTLEFHRLSTDVNCVPRRSIDIFRHATGVGYHHVLLQRNCAAVSVVVTFSTQGTSRLA